MKKALLQKPIREVLYGIGFTHVKNDDYEGGYKERKLYKRKTKEADIRLRIDYNEFIHASEEERLNIYNNHIVQSIRTLQKKLGPDFDYSKLEEDVKQALCMRENNCDQRNWEEEE